MKLIDGNWEYGEVRVARCIAAFPPFELLFEELNLPYSLRSTHEIPFEWAKIDHVSDAMCDYMFKAIDDIEDDDQTYDFLGIEYEDGQQRIIRMVPHGSAGFVRSYPYWYMLGKPLPVERGDA